VALNKYAAFTSGLLESANYQVAY